MVTIYCREKITVNRVFPILTNKWAMACYRFLSIIWSSWNIVILGTIMKASICLAKLPLRGGPDLILRLNCWLIWNRPLFLVRRSDLSFGFGALFLLFNAMLRQFGTNLGGNLHGFITIKPTSSLSIGLFHCRQEVRIILKSLQVLLHSCWWFSRWYFFYVEVSRV